MKVTSLEKEIIELIAHEVPNKEIAKILCYSQRNIEHQISKLFYKFGVQTRVGLIIATISMGLLDLSKIKKVI
ncbi:DNA-binding response regulator [Halobacillus litoralis]|uniref:DNA-binding response regulator n=1 Tax=Halobacillus litoralis TaxID=45668 RepID=A0A845FGR3_9BACI|nr:DNA-binding response regulator [Halobacillus litoralis]